MKGDPCLNHLHFPPKTSQTLHTHPAARIGVVLRGQGTCLWVDSEPSTPITVNAVGAPEMTRVPLLVGDVFEIPAGCVHAFETGAAAAGMDVVAWHPDSDCGPWHDDHPMVNRTIVDGISASNLDTIRTTSEQMNADTQLGKRR